MNKHFKLLVWFFLALGLCLSLLNTPPYTATGSAVDPPAEDKEVFPLPEVPVKSFKLENRGAGIWSPDGKWIATHSSRTAKKNNDYEVATTVEIWDAHTGQLKHSLGELKYVGFTNAFKSIAFSPNGKTLALSLYPLNQVGLQVEIWDVDRAAMTHTIDIPDHRGSLAFAFAPDGKRLAVTYIGPPGKAGLGARILAVATGKLLDTWWTEREDLTLSLKFSPDGKFLATAGRTGEILLWDTTTGKHIRKLAGPKSFGASLAFSSDNQILATGSSAGLHLWDIKSGKITELAGSDARIISVAFHPSGKLLAARAEKPGKRFQGTKLNLWSIKEGKILKTWDDVTLGVGGFAFGPDGKTLAIQTLDEIIHYWEVSTYLDKKAKRPIEK